MTRAEPSAEMLAAWGMLTAEEYLLLSELQGEDHADFDETDRRDADDRVERDGDGSRG